MDYERNVYDYPEKHDLTIISVLEFGGSYDFDTHVIFQHKDGRLF